MKRTRIYLVAAAMVLGLATVLAGAMPASAHNGRSRQTNVAKFALEALLNVTKAKSAWVSAVMSGLTIVPTLTTRAGTSAVRSTTADSISS
jgi:hypothetical protein